jgi:antitoxin (DNA-binding transcriptional repressor) of toxin-antitoxin stability system
MYHVKKASIRDLRYHFSKVEELLREGEEIHITKRKRVIARLLPPKTEKPAEIPDFLARQRKMFGKKRFKISGASQLAQERDRFRSHTRTPAFFSPCTFPTPMRLKPLPS